MIHVIRLGTAPTLERGADPRSPDYSQSSAVECRAFRRMLERRWLPPPDHSAVFPILCFAREGGLVSAPTRALYGGSREVCVRFRGAVGARFAARVEDSLPDRWDAIAQAEMVWDYARQFYACLVATGRLAGSDMPEVLRRSRPPLGVESLHTRWTCEAMILGALDTPLGATLVVRSAALTLALYSLNLKEQLAILATEGQAGGTRYDQFFLKGESFGEYILTHSNCAHLFVSTGELRSRDSRGRPSWLWNIHPRVLRGAFPARLVCESFRFDTAVRTEDIP